MRIPRAREDLSRAQRQEHHTGISESEREIPSTGLKGGRELTTGGDNSVPPIRKMGMGEFNVVLGAVNVTYDEVLLGLNVLVGEKNGQANIFLSKKYQLNEGGTFYLDVDASGTGSSRPTAMLYCAVKVLGYCSCSDVDTSELLKCGPCNKCRRKADSMLLKTNKKEDRNGHLEVNVGSPQDECATPVISTKNAHVIISVKCNECEATKPGPSYDSRSSNLYTGATESTSVEMADMQIADYSQILRKAERTASGGACENHPHRCSLYYTNATTPQVSTFRVVQAPASDLWPVTIPFSMPMFMSSTQDVNKAGHAPEAGTNASTIRIEMNNPLTDENDF
ncbi:hypothetical protein DPMN_187946 [Dreissena polymorpha]|uniref:Uncharacterized protein n=1 Tax=Dreissena polymorpha TaxID=45954 RepID=A0A9D4I806_DREPO|nr:hypothetical protein DPMN_187946 [Dreissena polymorpha]